LWRYQQSVQEYIQSEFVEGRLYKRLEVEREPLDD